jgi:hypothetical protein
MKIIALTIVVLIALIAFGGPLASKQTGIVTSDEHDYRKVEPFRSSEVGNTLARACGDCHSNQTSLPWYGHVAPVSWWIHKHIREGRKELNFSSGRGIRHSSGIMSWSRSAESSRMAECRRHHIGFCILNRDWKLRIRK